MVDYFPITSCPKMFFPLYHSSIQLYQLFFILKEHLLYLLSNYISHLNKVVPVP